jgi:tryptophan synthase alpha chain
MNRLDKKFRELKALKKKALIAYVTAGDPNLSVTRKLVPALERSGVDIVELGIPFSDPLADGPVIQAASHRALLKGATMEKVFSVVKDIRKYIRIPLVFMTYYNPVLRYGIEDFVKSCARAGVDGVIIPDLPYEEARALIGASRKRNIAAIFLAAPTSTRKRVKGIAKNSTGFIYYVSLTGVTGTRSALPAELARNIRMIKSVTKKPVAAGFGISTPAQAAEVARCADGVIVGSAVVKIISKYQKNEKALISKVSAFAKRLAEAVHGK